MSDVLSNYVPRKATAEKLGNALRGKPYTEKTLIAQRRFCWQGRGHRAMSRAARLKSSVNRLTGDCYPPPAVSV
jgi:hypothetical protein